MPDTRVLQRLRRLLVVPCIALIASLTSLYPASADPTPEQWASCDATPECVAWFDALRTDPEAVVAWIEAVALNAWYAAVYAADIHDHPFLVCTRHHESDHANPPLYDQGYQAYNPNGWHGAYQFALGTWDTTVGGMGRPDLIGVDPRDASVADQDAAALNLYQRAGTRPWGGRCSGL